MADTKTKVKEAVTKAVAPKPKAKAKAKPKAKKKTENYIVWNSHDQVYVTGPFEEKKDAELWVERSKTKSVENVQTAHYDVVAVPARDL